MVEGLPGPDFAGLKHYSLNIKAWGRLRYRVVPEPLVYCGSVYCGVLRAILLFSAFFCGLNRCCGYIAGIFLGHIAEKCDLTRGVVLFSDHMWCNCFPVHVICGF